MLVSDIVGHTQPFYDLILRGICSQEGTWCCSVFEGLRSALPFV
jgi:hypothetical protein